MNEKEYKELSERHYNGEKLSKEEYNKLISETLKKISIKEQNKHVGESSRIATGGMMAGIYHTNNYYENRMVEDFSKEGEEPEMWERQETSDDEQSKTPNGTPEEELAKLKEEQAEAERIYRRRMEMDALIDDPESIKELAKAILDRQAQIEDLEARIGQEKGDTQEIIERQNLEVTERSESEGKSLEVYRGNNPIVRWLYRLLQKLENGLAKFEERNRQLRDRDPMDWYREKVEEEKSYLKAKQYDEYRKMAKMELPKEKTPHEYFVEEVSGNGAYQTTNQDIKKAQEDAIKKAEAIQELSSEDDLSK